ncbi:hypothetical protein [uncultured Aquimarina sp.]|uniref:hypothetical protein n=1 Tax=uncultured Aquimarina sp. TaxID=575652 RepID=UPI0026031A98|nr:hypothetical protein [uncultured Aquimarina sp.]
MAKVLWVFLAVIISSCGSEKVVDLIIYDEYALPLPHFCPKLKEDLEASKLLDSIKFYGTPIPVSTLSLTIDTSAVKRLDIPIDKFSKRLKEVEDSLNSGSKNFQNVTYLDYLNPKDGKKIPFSSLVEIKAHSGYLQPEVFIPEPKEFYYKDERAVNVKLYVKDGKMKETLLFVKQLINSDYKKSFTKYEITTIKKN